MIMDAYEKKYKEALEKAKAYDNALEKAKYWYKEGWGRGCQELVEDIFPELAESEDEKIRKALINGFNKFDKSAVWYNGITNGQILAWLEKQGTAIKDTISMDVNSETEWDDIHEFLRMNLDGEKVKLLIIREE